MKQLILLTLTIFGSQFLFSQVMEERRVMALGEQNAFVIDIRNADERFVEKEWKDFIANYGRVKSVRRADESIVEAAQIIGIGGVEPVDLYSRVDKGVDGSTFLLWIDLGGRFLNSIDHGEGYVETVKLLQDFSHQVKVHLVEIELEEQEKQLSKLESEMSKLQRDNEGYHKDIEKAHDEIRKAEENIEKNIVEQETTNKEIVAQQSLVEAVRQKLDQTKKDQPNN